ncbi:hypothetical protein [Arthrobacter sp. GMC3]|uniref:hypothetical protein n=1 Tax=Arthrobacter sp. GMC3 TaxID=2058894 RepID=UPI000CE38764|nr:hypothetical protein [Arthrobacter sp. GMC3]
MTEPTLPPAAKSEQLLAPRSQLVGTVAALVGWIVVIVPIIATAALVFILVMNPDTSLANIGKIGLIFLGAVLLFCMIAAPHLVGQAVIHRERAMWLAALWTGIPTVAVIIFLLVLWIRSN